jgi:hypothetical protein
MSRQEVAPLSIGYEKQLLMLAFGRRGSLHTNHLGIEGKPGRGGP